MTHFVHDDDGYESWVARHPSGLVFKHRKAGLFMVHMAACEHIAWFGPRDVPAGEWRYTEKPGKWCFERRDEALAWVLDTTVETIHCTDCKPAFRPAGNRERHRVADPPADPAPGVARVGSLVEVEDSEESDAVQVYRIGQGPLPPVGTRMLKAESPVARALVGARAGDLVDVTTGAAVYSLRVVRVEDP